MVLIKARTFLTLLASLLCLCACAGPTSPFGAAHSLTPLIKAPPDISLISTESDKHYKVSFYPKQQFYHKEDSLRLDVHGIKKIPDIRNLRLIYNSTDLTELLVNNSKLKMFPNEKLMRIEFNGLKLSARQLHDITFLYQEDLHFYSFKLTKPSCSIYRSSPARGLHGFEAPPEFLNMVNMSGREEKISSSLIAGLVAMESGFNPLAVSSAKALGLTQITDVALQQIEKKTSQWPRRDLSSISHTEVKAQIVAGELTPQADWRLEPNLSLKGGASYLKYILGFWNSKGNKLLLEEANLTTEEQLTDVVLASYNSGPERVKRIITKSRNKWINDPELKNTQYYLNMIYSYCNDFAEGPRS